jgi:hypothetical protein
MRRLTYLKTLFMPFPWLSGFVAHSRMMIVVERVIGLE